VVRPVLQLYLSKESMGTALTTAKSSEVNVITPGGFRV
jgi:Adenylate cyclase associated (CAP) C terminal